ncbi:uncharacterized protein LOC130903682 [Diorhabda carinulata]|uniref:uncharacterized protein LOC130903682 n=1 Tax=Diorhabda carinulata TaxID=1163345 RepID=UPI0025A2D4A6|nr:uncharacterized protein LOC130903682 [Diorhabda carinulata]
MSFFYIGGTVDSKNGACRCIICACEDSKKAANTCNCPVCKCDPCNDPNINKLKEEQSKQPTICEGPVCICESCKDPNVKQPTEKQSKVVRNDDACLCDPCVCNSKKTTLIQSCDCPVCTCKPCADPNVKESIKTDNNNKDDRNLICTSPQCTCTNCERKKNINESNQKQNSPATVLPKCHCASCNCDRCLYNEQKKDATGEQSTKDVKSEICICTTCDCPDDKKYADEKCICGACACSKCPFGGEKKPSAATCYCNPCACVDCLTKTLKEAQQSDTNRNKVICDCKPCECVDCIFATKNCQCKKANAPVLEFKCSSLKVPMGPNKVEATAKTDISKFTNPPRTVQSTKNNCMCFDCHRIITNQNFQKFEIPTLLQSPPKAAHKHFELESLFKSIPENFTSQKNKNKHNKKVPLHSEFMFPDDETMEPTKLVGCTPEEIKNFLNKSYEKYYNDMNTGDYSNLDKYKDIVNVIRNSLKKIKNAREQVKDNKPFVKADFIETMSEVGIAFDYLKKSCKPNDKIIKAIAKEIKRYTSSTTFINLLGKPEKENKNNFIPGTRSLAHSHNHPMRVSVPTIPVLQPTMVSTRPSSAVPGQHRLERICGCPVCTESNDDFMYHSGDTRLKSGRNKLVKTRNYESYSNPVGNNLFRVQSPQFSPRESECVFHSVPQSDHSFNHTSNFHQTRMGDSDKRDINDKRGNLEMLNPILVKQASSIGPNTLSDLKVAITTLEAKCRAKDKIIEETAQKLRQHLSSSVLINLMNRIEGIPRYIEVDADTSVAAKKSSKNAQTQIDHLFKDKKGVPCKCGRIHKDNKHVCLNGFRIINIKRITSDSLVIEWKSPRSKAVCGYEIEINGKYKSRIMSGWRTCAMIHSVEMTAPLHVSIYAITSCGRCQPPAKAIYEIKRKEKDVGGKFKNKVNK